MPSKTTQRRAQGGGRTANSEPRLQVFKDFNGINFEHANQFSSGVEIDQALHEGDQSDLMMNYMFLQNNAMTNSNKTIETRANIIEMFYAPEGKKFTGPAQLIGGKLYIAKTDINSGTNPYNGIGMADLDARHTADHPLAVDTDVTLNQVGEQQGHTWTSLDYYDNKLIALTAENCIWTGNVNSTYTVSEMSDAKGVIDPNNIGSIVTLSTKGSLVISNNVSTTCPFRTRLALTYVNKYGPTKVSDKLTFYSNHPADEWHSGCYLHISGNFSPNTGTAGSNGIKAVELYYTADNAMELIYLDRIEVDSGATSWSYSWLGYIDATKTWLKGNLIAPTENYTKGVHASRVCNIDGRMYFWGDSNNMQRLYIGGNPGNLLSVSPGTGGGYADVEPGTNQEVRNVCKYKTQSGNSIVTLLCSSPNTKKEQRYNLVENSISLSNEQNMKSWQTEQVAGAVGCKSFYGALVCQDGLYSVSRYGLALTTMTMEYNSQIRTTYVSDQIKPVFTDAAEVETRLANAMLIELDGIIYLALGSESDQEGNLDNVLFCYDIDLKAWWTYTLDIDEPILNLFHMDWQSQQEGIGIVTQNKVYLLPTTAIDDDNMTDFLIETAQLTTQMPKQGWQYLSQLEFRFDWFVGEATIEVKGTDMFGRDITVTKKVNESQMLYDHTVHMRIDQRLMSYVITITGQARFRMTHFLARVYTLSNKIGQVWGFDDNIAHRSAGSVHPTFKCYNDIRKAIFT